MKVTVVPEENVVKNNARDLFFGSDPSDRGGLCVIACDQTINLVQ